HLEVVRVALVVKDVAAGDRRLREVPDERLLTQREVPKAVGVDLDDRCFADALEEIRPLRHPVRSVYHGGSPTRSRCAAMCTGQWRSAASFAASAFSAAGSPCTRYVIRGGRSNPDSHLKISPASACADIESTCAMCAATGYVRPISLISRLASTSC